MKPEPDVCVVCGKPIEPGAGRYRRTEGDIHVECDEQRTPRSPREGSGEKQAE